MSFSFAAVSSAASLSKVALLADRCCLRPRLRVRHPVDELADQHVGVYVKG